MGNLNIEKKIQDILNKNLLNAKRELLLFVNQTRETIKYQTDKQAYIKELLANYNRLSTDKDGCISFFGRWFVNSGFPVFSDEEVLAQMKHFYLCYVEKPMLGESGAIDAAEREGGLFLERWSKYNWLKELLAKMAEHQYVKVPTYTSAFNDRILAEDKDKVLTKLHSLINGKRGKNVALVIIASVEMGIINKPTYREVQNEFGDIGAESGYNKYMDKSKFTKVEYDGIKNRLSE